VPWRTSRRGVFEGTGKFTKRDDAPSTSPPGRSRIITAAGRPPGRDLLMGVNHAVRPAEATRSSRTRRARPTARAVRKVLTIRSSSERLDDDHPLLTPTTRTSSTWPHKDLRRAALRRFPMIPTTTGAARPWAKCCRGSRASSRCHARPDADVSWSTWPCSAREDDRHEVNAAFGRPRQAP